MLDCEIVLASPEPQTAAQIPAAGEAQVERERTVEQPDHGADVLAELSQHPGGGSEDARVVLPHFERLPSKIDGFAAGCLRRVGPAVKDEPHMAHRRTSQCRSV